MGFARPVQRSVIRRGFTVVEILVVLGIVIGVISTLIVGLGYGARRARIANTEFLMNSIVAGLTRGADPAEPGLAPVEAIAQALRAADIAPSKLRMAEVMEAYAVQAIACVEGAGLDPARVNPQGGALARGHPIGASGAVLAVTLFHGLARGHGLATIAAAGGIGTAMLVSR